MFVRIKQVKGNSYFYLIKSQRVEGKLHPVPKTITYLGDQDAAISRLSVMTILNKEQLIAQVRAATPSVGKNQGKRGRPRKNPWRDDKGGEAEKIEECDRFQVKKDRSGISTRPIKW